MKIKARIIISGFAYCFSSHSAPPPPQNNKKYPGIGISRTRPGVDEFLLSWQPLTLWRCYMYNAVTTNYTTGWLMVRAHAYLSYITTVGERESEDRDGVTRPGILPGYQVSCSILRILVQQGEGGCLTRTTPRKFWCYVSECEWSAGISRREIHPLFRGCGVVHIFAHFCEVNSACLEQTVGSWADPFVLGVGKEAHNCKRKKTTSHTVALRIQCGCLTCG